MELLYLVSKCKETSFVRILMILNLLSVSCALLGTRASAPRIDNENNSAVNFTPAGKMNS